MDKNTKAKVPAIRFKGFEGEWIDKKLKDVSSRFKSGEFLKAECISETGKYPVYGGNGLRGYTSTYNHNGLYALIGRQGALCGNTSVSTGKAFFTEHAIAVQANIESDTLFVFYKLGLMDLGQYSAQSAQPGLSVSNLIELEASFPNLLEQKQVSKYFEALDNKLECHQVRLDTLKNLKQVMLQKMFPQGDTTVPEIRFEGFIESWKFVPLGDIATIKTGSSNREDSILDGKYTFFDRSEDVRTSDIYLFDCEAIIVAGEGQDFIPKYFEGKFDLHQRTYAIMNFVNSLGAYLFYAVYLFRDHLYKSAVGSTVKSLRLPMFKEMLLPLPEIKEQQKIANYFRKLDELIALERVQLDKLKQIKQACLAGMFV